MQTVGAVPALVVVILLFAPQILSLDALGQALAAAIALVCVGGALLLALAGPFGWQGIVETVKTTDESEAAALIGAVFYPIGVAFLTAMLFAAAGLLCRMRVENSSMKYGRLLGPRMASHRNSMGRSSFGPGYHHRGESV